MLFLFTIIVNIMIWSTAIGDLLPFSPPGIHQHNQDVGLDNLCFMQTQITCMHLGCSRPLDQISFCPALSGTKSEINGHTSSSKESSYASNPVQYIESLHGSPFEVLEETINERREKLSPITGKFKDVDMSPLVEFCHPVSALEQVQHSENEVEAHNEVKGVSAGIPTDLDSSNLHESSCMSYVEWSCPEIQNGLYSPFYFLTKAGKGIANLVYGLSFPADYMLKCQFIFSPILDVTIMSKKCDKDSLYCLARSAEQRHNCKSLISCNGDDRDANRALTVQETNKFSLIMHLILMGCEGQSPSILRGQGMKANFAFETRFFLHKNLNKLNPPTQLVQWMCEYGNLYEPIDCSIAHLLFHRPPDASLMRANNAFSLRSHSSMHGFVTSPPVMAERLVFQEDTIASADVADG
ncbi:hypothetical protein I3843_06G145800 [Carya illinoinensis]|nr:hypothetical protein I3843_06G145800 [Carya illinoinensis]